MENFAQQEAQAREERREQRGFETTPLNVANKEYVLPDWAMSGSRIDRAVRELNESLPNGQKLRTEKAMRELRRGYEELAVDLRARGLDV